MFELLEIPLKMKPELQMSSGAYFDILNPHKTDFVIEDIAHALSLICRFTGHVSEFYSVAQHSVLVSLNVPPKYAMQALMHDATEAYLGDVSSPLKQLLRDYVAIERATDRAIMHAFGLPEQHHPAVKRADLMLLATERRDLMENNCGNISGGWSMLDGVPELNERIVAMQPKEAYNYFMRRFFEIQENKIYETAGR